VEDFIHPWVLTRTYNVVAKFVDDVFHVCPLPSFSFRRVIRETTASQYAWRPMGTQD
jgi:hypothetical protein